MTTPHWIALLALIAASSLMARQMTRRMRGGMRRFTQAPLATVGLGWLLFLVLAACAAPWLSPYRPSQQLDIVALASQSPSWLHPLGTDLLSRDILSRMLYGARISLGVGLLAMTVALTVGGVIGMTAGYFRRGYDATVMRLVDVGMAVPRIFIILVAIAFREQLALTALILLLGLTGWFGTSRLIRADVLSLRHAPFVDAARAMGAGHWRIMSRHLLPNVAAPLLVTAVLGIGNAMLLEASLSFLGVGVQPPTPSWGNMIADGRDQLATAPWTTLFPGLAIALAVVALNAVGDGLRDAMDPKAGE